jgi:hypothetical protein
LVSRIWEFACVDCLTQVYNVVIDKRPSCTCERAQLTACHWFTSFWDVTFSGPDATKGNHCKHIVSSSFPLLISPN